MGYGDYVPKTNPQRIFTAFWIIFGVSITGSIISTLNERIYTHNERLKSRRDDLAERELEQMQNTSKSKAGELDSDLEDYIER